MVNFKILFCRLDIVHLNENQLVVEGSDDEVDFYEDDDDSNGTIFEVYDYFAINFLILVKELEKGLEKLKT